MSTNAPFNLETKEKRNRREFYPWGNIVSHWLRFIVLLFYYVSLHDKMQGGSRTDGGIRWLRRNLKPCLLSAMLPPPPLGIINRIKHKMLSKCK